MLKQGPLLLISLPYRIDKASYEICFCNYSNYVAPWRFCQKWSNKMHQPAIWKILFENTILSRILSSSFLAKRGISEKQYFLALWCSHQENDWCKSCNCDLNLSSCRLSFGYDSSKLETCRDTQKQLPTGDSAGRCAAWSVIVLIFVDKNGCQRQV